MVKHIVYRENYVFFHPRSLSVPGFVRRHMSVWNNPRGDVGIVSLTFLLLISIPTSFILYLLSNIYVHTRRRLFFFFFFFSFPFFFFFFLCVTCRGPYGNVLPRTWCLSPSVANCLMDALDSLLSHQRLRFLISISSVDICFNIKYVYVHDWTIL